MQSRRLLREPHQGTHMASQRALSDPVRTVPVGTTDSLSKDSHMNLDQIWDSLILPIPRASARELSPPPRPLALSPQNRPRPQPLAQPQLQPQLQAQSLSQMQPQPQPQPAPQPQPQPQLPNLHVPVLGHTVSSLGSRSSSVNQTPQSAQSAKSGPDTPCRRVRFNSIVSEHDDFTPYASVYGKHPQEFNFDRNGQKILSTPQRLSFHVNAGSAGRSNFQPQSRRRSLGWH